MDALHRLEHIRPDCIGPDDPARSGIAERAIEQGGHVRVGLEDYAGPRSPTNVELVSEIAAMAERAGRPLATPAQARTILVLPPVSNV